MGEVTDEIDRENHQDGHCYVELFHAEVLHLRNLSYISGEQNSGFY